MNGNFLYCENDWFAKCQYPICYSSVICHALFKIYQQSSEKTQKYFDELKNNLKSTETKPYICKTSFLDVYPIHMEDGSLGRLLVDRSRGIFPLVFYTDSNSSDFEDNPAASKLYALTAVLTQIDGSFSKITEEFEKHKSEIWSYDLQKKLHSYFNVWYRRTRVTCNFLKKIVPKKFYFFSIMPSSLPH